MLDYINIIKYLLIHNNYNKYINTISLNLDNKEIVFLYKCLEELHSKYKKDISLEEYIVFVLSNCLSKDKDVYESILKGLQSSTRL